jgi:hypothetical protein
MNGLIGSRPTRLKEILEVFGLVDLQTVCLPKGGEKDCFRALGQEFEQFTGYFHGVLPLSLCFLKKGGNIRVHSVHQLINPFGFEVRGDLEQFLPMGRMFDLLFSIKTSRMKGHPFAFDPDLHMVGIGQQFTRGTGERRGNGVAIRVKLDKPGLTDRGADELVR